MAIKKTKKEKIEKEKIKINKHLVVILTIILVLAAYAFYISEIAENRCIRGAEKESKSNVSQEIINWCRNTF